MGPAKVPAVSPFIYNERRAAGVLRSWGNAEKKALDWAIQCCQEKLRE